MNVLHRLPSLVVFGVFVIVVSVVVVVVDGLSVNAPGKPATPSSSSSSLRSLLIANRELVSSLKEIANAMSTDECVCPNDDVFYLRYALDDAKTNDDERIDALKSSIAWRSNEGRSIVTSARMAIARATSSSGEEGGEEKEGKREKRKWNNDHVRDAAPHSEIVSRYLTTEQCITTSLPSTGDLVYCIRAGRIDDVGLMSEVSIDDMVEFFLYCKEVNSAVADLRSLESDTLVKLITCNDLGGVKLVGGSPDLRKALSAASKRANELYPTFNGRTLMLNPPALLGALVRLFTPLFPKAVRGRLRFVSGPLGDVVDLREISEGGTKREDFANQVDALAYD